MHQENSGEVITSPTDWSSQAFKNYFQFLDPSPKEIFTVMFMTEGNGRKKPVSGYSYVHDSVDGLWETYNKLFLIHGNSLSMHVTLNRTDLLGRRAKNIVGPPRVLCLDLDGAPMPESFFVQPHCIVESSPGRFHIYWKLSSNMEGESITLQEWQVYQRALAFKYNGDKNIDSLSHTIRVPGLARNVYSGGSLVPTMWLSTPQYSPSCFPVTRKDLFAHFPDASELANSCLEARRMSFKELNKMARKQGFLMSETFINPEAEAKLGRNNLLYVMVKRWCSKFDPALSADCWRSFGDALLLGEDINKRFTTPLEADEVYSTVRSAHEKGLVRWQKKKEKYLASLGKLTMEEVQTVETGEGVEVQSSVTKVTEQEQAVLNGSSNGLANGTSNGSDHSGFDHTNFNYDFDDPWLSGNSLSDFGLAGRVMQRFPDLLVNCENSLLAFNDFVKLWKTQEKGNCPELQAMYGQIVYELRTDERFLASYCTDKDGFNQTLFRKALDRFESEKKLRAVSSILLGSSRPKILTKADFDSQDEMFNVANGLLNLNTGIVREVQASDYIRAQSSVEYVENATCPRWKSFVSDVFGGDMEMVKFLQEVFGYSLTGSISAQVMFCHYGRGSNGKSKVLSALRALMGDYGTFTDPDDIGMNGKKGARAFERIGAKAEGRRVVIVDDLEISETWSESAVKGLTSRYIRARAEYEKSREIINRAKIHVGLNEAPKPQSENYGMLRRLAFIPYNVRFKPSIEESKRIDRLITEELSGILNWAIEGFRRMKSKNNGELVFPTASVEALDEYKEENFDTESLILEMWEPCTEEECVKENFYPTEELLSDFNQRLMERTGGTKKGLNSISLGREIQNVLRAKCTRLRTGAEARRGFFLKLSYTRKHGSIDKL